MNYKGFELRPTTSGGKAGRGANNTASIRVVGVQRSSGALMCRYVRYRVGDSESYGRAQRRARDLVDRILYLQ